MGQGLDVGVRADPAAATGAVTLLEHLPAGVDAADDAAHVEVVRTARVDGLVGGQGRETSSRGEDDGCRDVGRTIYVRESAGLAIYTVKAVVKEAAGPQSRAGVSG